MSSITAQLNSDSFPKWLGQQVINCDSTLVSAPLKCCFHLLHGLIKFIVGSVSRSVLLRKLRRIFSSSCLSEKATREASLSRKAAPKYRAIYAIALSSGYCTYFLRSATDHSSSGMKPAPWALASSALDLDAGDHLEALDDPLFCLGTLLI